MRGIAKSIAAVIFLAGVLPAAWAGTPQVTGTPGAPEATTTLPGSQVPPLDPTFGGVIKERADASTPWWPPRIVAPKRAPNVLLIMTDDQGFGAPSTFGGVIPTPTMDKLAAEGLRYTNFHSTAICSSTRAAIITGRNHHVAGFGSVGEVATGYPGYDSIIRREEGTIGQILQGNGYGTAWFGKDHNVPFFQNSQAGPFSQWPNNLGFDYFYGFVGGDTSQWEPYLFRNTTPIFPWVGHEGWNLTTAMADEAIAYMREQKALAPDQPFFVYYVPGGTHAPHHPTADWIGKVEAMHLFDGGWNKLRDTIFANQTRLGVMPPNAVLTEWPKELPQWESLDQVAKDLFIKQMNVYGAYLAYTDHEIGRVVQAVEDLGQRDNTLIIYIGGDNGASPEGGLNGTPNEFTFFNGLDAIPVKDQLPWYEFWGSERTFPHYSAAWAWAMGTPFKWVKQIASHYGGTAQGVVMSWPGHIPEGGIRRQFHHIIDITPTILDATGVTVPTEIDGVPQAPFDGVSMTYSWKPENQDAASTRQTQYFEMMGNRAIYHDGWIAATTPVTLPWALGTATLPDVIDGYNWELYNVAEDPTESNDLAKQMPDKVKEMQALFYAEAAKYDVLPMDNSSLARWNTPRPSLTAGRTLFTYQYPVAGIPGSTAPHILDKRYRITADITVPEGGAEGMLVTQGGRFGGYGLFLSHGEVGLDRGRVVFLYNLLDLKRTIWEGPVLDPGRHRIVFEFTPEAEGLGKGGTGVLSVDGKEVDREAMDHTTPITFPEDETFDIGSDTRTPLALLEYRYETPFSFTGTINAITVDTDPK